MNERSFGGVIEVLLFCFKNLVLFLNFNELNSSLSIALVIWGFRNSLSVCRLP